MKNNMKFFGWISKLSNRKKILLTVVITIIIFVVFRLFSKKANGYETTTPSRESVVEYITETGNIIASNAVPVFSTTNGVVKTIYVSNGDAVLAEDKLFEVTSTASPQEKTTAWSSYLAAKTALDAAKATEYSMQASMFDKWDTYRNKYDDDDFDEETDVLRNEPEFQVPQKEWLAAETQPELASLFNNVPPPIG